MRLASAVPGTKNLVGSAAIGIRGPGRQGPPPTGVPVWGGGLTRTPVGGKGAQLKVRAPPASIEKMRLG